MTDLLRVGELLVRYDGCAFPKEDVNHFFYHLTQERSAWFVEAGDVGLMYLTNVVPRGDATLHTMFWDGTLVREYVAAVKMFVADAFERFDLARLSARVSFDNHPIRRFYRDVGFTLEGVVRSGWSFDPPVDLVLFGMLKEEKPEGTLPFMEGD